MRELLLSKFICCLLLGSAVPVWAAPPVASSPVKTAAVQSVDELKYQQAISEGHNLLQTHHFSESLARFDEAIRLKPKSCLAYSLRARVLRYLGRDNDAAADIQKAKTLDPKSVQPYLSEAAFALKDHNTGKARAYLLQADKIEPHNFEVVAFLGTVYSIEKNYKQALVRVNEAIKLKPDGHRYAQRAGIYRILGDRKKELADYDKAIALEPNSAIFATERATTYLQSGKFAQALAEVNKAIKLDPRYGHAYYIKAHVDWNQKRSGRTIEDLAKAIELDPTNAAFYYFRGTVYNVLGEARRALNDQIKADNLAPNTPHIKAALADMYHKMLEPKAALEAISAAIKLDPKNAEYYERRAEVYRMLMDYELSVADDTRAIEFAKKPPINPLINRIRYYRMRKKFDLALKDQNKIISYFPKKVELKEGRSVIYQEMGDNKNAKKDLDDVILSYPTDHNYIARAEVNFKLKNYKEALTDCNKAIVLQPGMSSYYLVRANIHAAAGKMDEARKDKAAARAADEASLPPR